MMGILGNTMRATRGAAKRQSNKQPGAQVPQDARDAGDDFLGMLTPEIIELPDEEDNIIDIGDL